MRTTLLLLALLGTSGAFAQDFRCVVPGADRFFSDGTMLGLRVIDSETVPQGVLHHFHHDLRPVAFGDPSGCFIGPDCGDPEFGSVYYTTQGASWLGTSMLAQPDGHDLFFNKDGDTIRVNTLAMQGESWDAFHWGDTARLEATVSAMATETVMGAAQVVKTIAFQALDANGASMAHPLNGAQWKLSQYDGLIQLHALYWFPDFPDPSLQVAYDCVEQYYPDHEHYSDALIVQTAQIPPSEGTMYDFEIGDEVQMREVTDGPSPGLWYSLYTVTAKEFLNDALTVTFSVERFNAATEELTTSTTVVASEDTSNIYPMNALPGLGAHVATAAEVDTVYFPFGLMGGGAILSSFLEACPSKAVRLNDQYQVIDSTGPGCAAYYLMVDGMWGDRFRIAGIPVPVSQLSTIFGETEVIPVYVNTSACQFGDRVIVGVGELGPQIMLHPNPTTSSLRFEAKAPSAYTITDMMGRMVQQGRVQVGENELQVSALPDGIYLLRSEGTGAAARFVKGGE